MSNMVFAMGTIQDLQECLIDTEDLRKSIDSSKAIIHVSNMTAEQIELFRTKTSILALSVEETEALMITSDWTEVV